MRKILSVLLAVVLCICSCYLGVSASNESMEGVGVAVLVEAQSSVSEAQNGDTFTVDFMLTSNIGFNTLGIKVSYDEDVLEIVCPKHSDGKNCTGTRNPVKNQLSMSPDGATNNGTNSKTHDINPYIMQWAFGVAEEDVVGNELLGTLTFRVLDETAFGETSINVSVDQGSSIEYGTYIADELAGVGAQVRIVCKDHIAGKPEVLTAATCEGQGYQVINCTRCGVQLSAQTIPALGHNVEAWNVTRKATSTANGSKNGTCLNCGNTITNSIPKVTTPNAPVSENVNSTFVELKTQEGFEYSKDGVNWQSEGLFLDLKRNTSYSFYQRTAATVEAEASAKSAALTVKTKAVDDIVVTPTAGEVAIDDTIEMPIKITNNNGFFTLGIKVEYDSNVLELVCPNHKNGQNCVGANCPVANLLNEVDGVLNNGTVSQFHTVNPYVMQWVFSLAEEDITYKGNLGVLTFKAKSSAVAGSTTSVKVVVTEASNVDDTRISYTGGEVDVKILCKNHSYGNWVVTQKASSTVKGSKYHVCSVCDYTETVAIDCVAVPAAPTVAEFTTDTVTLNAVSDMEYSIDGKTWQKSNVFSGLADDTEYTFYQRYVETETTFASDRSVGTVQKTERSYMPGDIDDDGDITLRDVVALAQILAEWDDVVHNPKALDPDGDGDTTLRDIVHLAQYLAEWDGIELY